MNDIRNILVEGMRDQKFQDLILTWARGSFVVLDECCIWNDGRCLFNEILEISDLYKQDGISGKNYFNARIEYIHTVFYSRFVFVILMLKIAPYFVASTDPSPARSRQQSHAVSQINQLGC